MELEIMGIPAIACVTYFIVNVLKNMFNSEGFTHYLPAIAGVVGAACGVLAYFFLPEIIATQTISYLNNAFGSGLVGALSGLSATGCNQIIKQLSTVGVEITGVDEIQEIDEN